MQREHRKMQYRACESDGAAALPTGEEERVAKLLRAVALAPPMDGGGGSSPHYVVDSPPSLSRPPLAVDHDGGSRWGQP